MEIIGTYLTGKVLAYVGGSVAGFVLLWIFKRIDNAKISGKVEAFFHGLGKYLTLTLSKKSKLWAKYIEPWFIDFIENTVCAALRGFIKGLRSD